MSTEPAKRFVSFGWTWIVSPFGSNYDLGEHILFLFLFLFFWTHYSSSLIFYPETRHRSSTPSSPLPMATNTWSTSRKLRKRCSVERWRSAGSLPETWTRRWLLCIITDMITVAMRRFYLYLIDEEAVGLFSSIYYLSTRPSIHIALDLNVHLSSLFILSLIHRECRCLSHLAVLVFTYLLYNIFTALCNK